MTISPARWPAVPPTLSDGHVLLRVPEMSDVDDITRGARDPDVQRFTSIPSPYLPEHAVWFVDHRGVQSWGMPEARRARDSSEPLLQAAFVIRDVATGEFLGTAGLEDVDLAHHIGEVGYWLAPEARGRGVMTRAVALVLDWAFHDVGLREVKWLAVVGNDRSRAVAERHGFVIDGEASCRNGAGEESPAWSATLTAEQFRHRPTQRQ